MKKTIAFASSIILFFIGSIIYAQGVTNEPEENIYLSNKYITVIKGQENFAGSPYENEEFKSGNIYRDGKLLTNNVGVRYNVIRDEIEVKPQLSAPNRHAKVLAKSSHIYIKVLNKLYVYDAASTQETVSGYFLVLLESEQLSIYKKLTKSLIEGKKSINSITRDVPPSYKNRDKLYLVNSSGLFTEVPSSKNGRVKVLDTNKKELKLYIKEKKLNINKDYDFIKLIKYYNTL
jgi:hypothetical protein